MLSFKWKKLIQNFMLISNQQKKHFRAIGHNLRPVVTISHKGLTDNLGHEIDRALNDHELIKIKINTPKREVRKEITSQICQQHNAEFIQSIGHIALVYRPSKTTNSKLSNLSQVSA
tara:strand:- start:86 stop:436 length:351 start_codon:yes stop_codon:yes gene_type:complete